MNDVTRVLSAIEAGDPLAADRLLPLVYAELRRLAAAQLAREQPGQTLNATGLVHEAYLRLVGHPNSEARNPKDDGSEFGVRSSDFPRFEGRAHFFAAAAEAMRRILVEQARRKRRLKHGGERRRVPLTDAVAAADQSPDDLLALDDALARLAAEDPPAAEVVKLRVYAGLSVEEAAAALGLARATAYRHWTYARAWLRDALGDDEPPAA